MTINLLVQITICAICITIFMGVLNSYRRTQKLLRWWYCRQAQKLSLEAEKIRDNLLQQSFTIRRNLEALTMDNVDSSTLKAQDCLVKIESLHKSLTQLSDRLFPIYLENSFPSAIQCLLESWLTSHPYLWFDTDVPSFWRQDTLETSLIVFTTLDELLRISLPEAFSNISIYLSLRQNCTTGKLMVKIIYPDESTFISDSRIRELKHLCETFESLTSRKFFLEIKNSSYFCDLYW